MNNNLVLLTEEFRQNQAKHGQLVAIHEIGYVIALFYYQLSITRQGK
jgi:hypothetical protein